jgi:hypothetical protein
MTNKRIRLPKEGIIERVRTSQGPDGVDRDDDVEGHGFVNPAPPADFSKRSPSSGGEFAPTDEDEQVGPTH